MSNVSIPLDEVAARFMPIAVATFDKGAVMFGHHSENDDGSLRLELWYYERRLGRSRCP